MSVSRAPAYPSVTARLGSVAQPNRFRLGAKNYALKACVCLYRQENLAAGLSEYLVLTPDMRFAHVARNKAKPGEEIDFAQGAAPNEQPVGLGFAAIELEAGEARDFLTAHGEGELVEDFPDLFAIVQRANRLATPSKLKRNKPHYDTAH